MKHTYDMIIIGGGPGGYTTALYAARAGLNTLVLEKLSAGGQMALTTQIDNYPGFVETVDGFTLGEQMQKQTERFGAKTLYAEVLSMDLTSSPKYIQTSDGDYYAHTVVIATGANPRMLELSNEQELIGRGVSYCATCDGMFYRNKTVVIVGGGNTAVADALHLSRICEKVILVHRRDSLRASKIYHEQLKKAANIEFYWNSKISELIADEYLSAVVVTEKDSDIKTLINCDGIFIAIGRNPATELVNEQLALDEAGYIIADESTQTNIPGVFAVGDVRTKAVRQIVTATADGAVAAHYAEEYLSQRANA